MKLPSEVVERLRPVYQGRRVCVTGGAGFIGGHLLDALLSLGADIAVIDDLSNSEADHVADLIDLEPERIRFMHGSILEDRALAEAVDESALVFHLAALGSVQRSVEDPERTWLVNATGTLRVLEAARSAGASRIVFAASSSAYGDASDMPLSEKAAPRPRSPYAASKLAGEHLCSAWSRTYGMSTVCLRYFNVFGPRQRADSPYAAVVAAFARSLLAGEPPIIYGDGNQSRDFTFVGNAVLGTLLAGATDRALHGEVVNIAAGQRRSVLDLATAMRDLIGGPAPEFRPGRSGDVRDSQADITLANELLAYQPVTPFEEGLEETVRWYREALAQA